MLLDGAWSVWSAYSSCTASCGNYGTSTRNRTCTNPAPSNGGAPCKGFAYQTLMCNFKSCPVDGAWGVWSAYSPCTASCGNYGTSTRNRTCTNPSPSHVGAPCKGSAYQTLICNFKSCPVDGHWTSWSAYGPCSKSCGDGQSYRYRTCTNPAPSHGGVTCSGLSSMFVGCNHGSCPVDGQWASWSTYGPCSKPCGDGLSYRYRTCTNPVPSHGGVTCGGWSSMPVGCNHGPCPVDGHWTSWSNYGPCSQTCGDGLSYRYRTCTHPDPSHGGVTCSGLSNMTAGCNHGSCPVNGHWSAWSPYSHCTATCGSYGTQTRNRTCTNPAPSNGGAMCHGASSDLAACNRVTCPDAVNVAWSSTWGPWSSYGPCSCRSGSRTRYRSCNSRHYNSGCTGGSQQTVTCDTHHCEWHNGGVFGLGNIGHHLLGSTAMSSFTPLSNKNKLNTTPVFRTVGKRVCEGNNASNSSNTVDGQWGSWSAYGACSRTCGRGIYVRYRTCTRPVPSNGGAPCFGQNRQSAICHIRECPVDGQWTLWSVYNPCSKTCGGGIQRRFRTCTNPAPAHGGVYCRGSDHQGSLCNRQDCPVDGSWGTWTRYGTCSVSCGSGVRSRTRTCTNPVPSHGGAPCQGMDLQNVTCVKHKCPVDGNWATWTRYGTCSLSCGSGVRSRTRTCTNPAPTHGGAPCQGPDLQNVTCVKHKCPVAGDWSRWSAYGPCSTSCGTGVRTRQRACTNPAPLHGGAFCRGSDQQTKPCQMDVCPEDGHWGSWSHFSPCTQSCGFGTHTRHRQCKSPTHDHSEVSCKGSAVEIAPCRLRACQGHRG